MIELPKYGLDQLRHGKDGVFVEAPGVTASHSLVTVDRDLLLKVLDDAQENFDKAWSEGIAVPGSEERIAELLALIEASI